MSSSSIRASRGAAITGLLAVIYGLGVAFLPLTGLAHSLWLYVGAAIVGVLFLVTMVIPWIRSLGSPADGTRR